jgi:hypothetical protein
MTLLGGSYNMGQRCHQSIALAKALCSGDWRSVYRGINGHLAVGTCGESPQKLAAAAALVDSGII